MRLTKLKPAAPLTFPAERLDSWKEIAAYLGRGVRTVVRWEQEEGLPVHRIVHEKRGSVYSYRSELDEWLRNRGGQVQRNPKTVVYLGILACLIALAIGILLLHRGASPAIPRVGPLTSYPGAEFTPCFSPDANAVAFAWFHDGNQDVYTRTLNSEKLQRLTTDPASDEQPAWSPDGRTIAFLRQLSATRRAVMLVPAAGGPERRIAELEGNLSRALAWASDSVWLLATHRDTTGAELLYWISTKTGEWQTFTTATGAGQRDVFPAISPDSRTVAFIRNQPGGRQVCFAEAVAQRTVSRAPRCRDVPEGGDLNQVSWMPGGSRLLYLGSDKLWILPVSGSESSRLAWAGGGILSFAYSPGTARLVFSRGSVDSNIWTRSLDGDVTGRQIASSTRWDAFPEYSPDGRGIAFYSDRSGSRDLWIANADGSDSRRITEWRDSSPEGGSPRWSPDGTRIATAKLEGDGIRIVEVATGLNSRVPDTAAGDWRPVWSADGLWIFFQSRRDGSPRIWKAPVAGGKALPVTTSPAFGGAVSPDGKYLYFTRAATAPGVWRVPVLGGEEEEVFKSLVFHLNLVPRGDRIYFVRVEDKDPEPAYYLSLYDLRNARVRDLWKFAKPASFGLSISPDGRNLLFAQLDEISADLMLAEDVR